MRGDRCGLATIAALLAALASAPAARADARDEARALAEVGAEKFEAGDFAAAIDLFERAEARFHAPPHWLYLARAHANRGSLVKARGYYERIVAERLPSGAPAAFREAQRSAEVELVALVGSMPRLTVRAAGVRPEDVVLTLDGTAAKVDVPAEVDPGRHVVVAHALGRTVTREVTVTSRAAEVTLDLRGAAADDTRALRLAGFVTLALGGVGGTLGTSALVASATQGDPAPLCADPTRPEAGCSQVASPPSQLGTIAAAGLVVGAVGASIGGVMLFVDHARRREPATAAPVALDLGPGSFVLRGRF